ncbi:MAG TPA: hypothetical protein VL856_06735 [Acidimicrobiia bacterium]|nr:hypothetical protein [Acidimicrobiia bacterium]
MAEDREDKGVDVVKIIAIVVLIGILIAFVADNTRKVRVGFVFADKDTRLIYVLIVTVIIGIVIDRLVQYARKH